MWPNPQFTADLLTFTAEILQVNFLFFAEFLLYSMDCIKSLTQVLITGNQVSMYYMWNINIKGLTNSLGGGGKQTILLSVLLKIHSKH